MDSKMIKAKAIKPFLLKDYLLDDFSSCSSNGFKSFPRTQCCSTVRYLIDTDFKNKKNPPTLLKNPSKSASSTTLSSAFQCVINAVKNLPFAAKSSAAAAQKKSKKPILPRSLSKKILKKSFWKRTSNHMREIERWKSLDHLVKEKPAPFSSASESNDSKSKTNSWSDSDFTASDDSSHVSTEERDDVVDEKKVMVVTNDDVSLDSITSSEASASTSTSTNSSQTKEKEWRNEKKEQFSPVSVLDCPFEDDDEVSSPFQHRLALMEGTKKKLMKKLERFECLAQLEPVNLTKRFVGPESNDNESVESSLQHSEEKIISDIEKEEEENQAEQKALKLLHLLKSTMPSLALKLYAENLLLDYFREKITNECLYSEKIRVENSFYDEIFDQAKDWINGKPYELFLEWGVQKNRLAHVKDMEKGLGREWTSLDEQIKEVALDLEAEIYGSLMDELFLDLKIVMT